MIVIIIIIIIIVIIIIKGNLSNWNKLTLSTPKQCPNYKFYQTREI